MPPVHRLVIYRPKAGHSDQLESLLRKHAPVLRDTGLLADDKPFTLYRAQNLRDHGTPGAYFIEIFHWRDDKASDLAHQTPAVMAVWETMGPHIEDMTLTSLEPLT